MDRVPETQSVPTVEGGQGEGQLTFGRSPEGEIVVACDPDGLTRHRDRTGTETSSRTRWSAHARLYRLCVLLLVALTSFGGYFAFAQAAALETWILGRLGINNVQFGLVMSAHLYPAVVMVFIVGMLCDRFGYAKLMITLSGITLFGVLGQVGGVAFGSYALFVVSRIVFGVGAESLVAAQSPLMAVWFRDKEFSTAMGFSIAMSRLGLLVSFVVSSRIAAEMGLVFALTVGLMFCGFSTASILAYYNFEFFARRTSDQFAYLRAWAQQPATDKSSDDELEAARAEQRPLRGEGTRRHAPWRRACSHFLRTFGHQVWLIVSSVTGFPLMYWLGLTVAALYYSAVVPFISIATRYLELRYGIIPQSGGIVVAIPNICSVVLSLIAGWPLDRFGKRGIVVSVGALIGCLAFPLFAFSSAPPVVMMVLLGVGFALVPDGIWPALSMCVEVSHVGTAMGLAFSVLSLGQIIINPIAGIFVDRLQSYTPMLMLFFGLTVAGFGLSVLWNVLDFVRYRRVINNPSKEFMTEQLSEAPSAAAAPVPPAQRVFDYGTI